MSRKVRRRLFVLMWAFAVISTLYSFWENFSQNNNLIQAIFNSLIIIVVGIVGTLIFDRQPRNPVGWTFLGAFLYIVVTSLFRLFVQTYLSSSARIPFLQEMFLSFVDAYLDGPVNVALWGALFLFPILYFPDGELVSPRWRYLIWLISIFLIVLLVSGIFLPDLEAPLFPDFRNPYSHPLGKQIWEGAGFLFFPLFVIAPLSLVIRFRKARGIERQQIKWPLLSALIMFISILFYLLAFLLYLLNVVPYETLEEHPIARVALLFEQISVLTFPVTIGIAILRYRLYDIDIIIRKTIQYTLVSGILALVYFGIVTQLGSFFNLVTGQDSPLSIVISTLAIAALFNPLRRRVQIFIDRRFYRRKYDAERTLQAFAAALRNEVDLDQLSSHLVSVVTETMQPESVSLWIMKPKEPADGSPAYGRDSR